MIGALFSACPPFAFNNRKSQMGLPFYPFCFVFQHTATSDGTQQCAHFSAGFRRFFAFFSIRNRLVSLSQKRRIDTRLFVVGFVGNPESFLFFCSACKQCSVIRSRTCDFFARFYLLSLCFFLERMTLAIRDVRVVEKKT